MRRGLASAADHIASYGRGPDTMLAHISPDEARFIDNLQGGRRTNPMTGLPEYGLFGKILKGVIRAGAAVGGFVASGGNPAVAAAAAGAATKLTGGSWKQSLKSAALTGLTAGAGNMLQGGSLWANEGLKQAGQQAAAGELAKQVVPTGLEAGSAQGLAALAPEAAKTGIGGLGSMLAPIGGMTGAGVGLAAYSAGRDRSAPGQFTPPAPGPQPNLNVMPFNRQMNPYTGDYATYGQRGAHQFFDVVNPSPVPLPPRPVQEQERLEESFMARGGRAMSPAARMGRIDGPGTETSDSIPAMLSAGEHVLDGEVVRLIGGGNRERGHQKIEKLKTQVRKKAGLSSPHLSAVERAKTRMKKAK